jgi:dTDP-4-amino-4,6-dideoxygalactose transaminase
VYHLAVFRHPAREAVRAELAAAGVATAVHYPLALTRQPAYVEFARAACPIADGWADECVTVPCFPELTEEEVELVAGTLARVTP